MSSHSDASRPAVLFVGRRGPALAAARALDLDVVCVDEKPPGRKEAAVLADFVPCRLEDPQTDWRGLARRAANGRRVGAVFALTERAVVPAAELRLRLGLGGDSPEAARRSTDKVEMKRAAAGAGIPCARFIDGGQNLRVDELVAELGLPVVFKGRVSSGGRQNRIFRRRDEIRRKPRRGWMAEGFVDGVEMSLEALVARGRTVFVNATEYFRVRWANILPAVLPEDVLAAVADLNQRVLAAVGIDTAFTHLELFLTPEGPVFGEIAARPPGGHITELIELAYGFDPWQAWLRLGLGEDVSLPARASRAAGVWVLHPGKGVVRSVSGLEQARAVPGVEDVRLRVRPGTTVARRVGAGQEVGAVVVTGRDRDEVAQRLLAAHERLRIELDPADGLQPGG
ncbi:MAG TPA: ATP-grasp domain-containing protein [Thermoanaerobaculia bacterium]|jgi:biotin carboxylase